MTQPPPDRHIPELVSLTEAADILDVSRTLAHRMVLRGDLPGRLVGKTWVFRKVVVERMAKRRSDAKKENK